MLPVIFLLKTKPQRLEASCQMCLPLIRAIQTVSKSALEKRWRSHSLLLLPKVKTSWTDKADVITAGLAYLKNHLDTITQDETEHLRQHSSDEEDFFSSLTTKRSEGTGELDGYPASPSDKMDSLHLFPYIKKLSLKLNTGLPASAACEPLF
uniref:Uncharacterized protein n=1 Tax=Hucho hucho TaxID=62062 RepID=A0A4W5JWM5_9TELE